MLKLVQKSVILCLCLYLIQVNALADTDSSVEGSIGTRSSYARPELIITATPNKTNYESVGRSVGVVLDEEIDNTGKTSVADIVDTISGVKSSNIGGPGSPGNTPLEIRGVRTGGTQLLINGLSLSDPSSISGTYESFFSYLVAPDVERIEVLKGGSGVLYGSDGQGGAVNLILKSPERASSAFVSFEGGSYDTFAETLTLNGGGKQGGLRSTISRTDSNGLDDHGNYENLTVSLLGEAETVDGKTRLIPLFRLIQAEVDLDTNPSLSPDGKLIPNQDTEKNNSDANGYILGGTLESEAHSHFQHKASFYTVQSKRDFFFDFDGFESVSNFEGDSLNAQLQTTALIPIISSKLTAGVEFEHQEYRTDSGGAIDSAQRDQYALFIYNQTSLLDELVDIGGGGRITGVSNTSKTITTLEAALSFKVPETPLRAHSSIAQGFRAPTLFESSGEIVDFDTGELVNVGNDSLNEEESLSFDVGLEAALLEGKVIGDVTYFLIDADETIIFDFENQTHRNGGGGESSGVETSISIFPTEFLSLRGAFTHLAEAEGLDGERRQRTPRNWFSVSGSLDFTPLKVSAEVRYRDTQEIAFFGVADRYKEDDVTLLNIFCTYAVNKHTALFVRGENIFDEDYTEAGFTMPGASVFGGFRFTTG